ncbi:MAG TPA: V-type ATP synthase subunit C [Oceanithermus profundus]|uniref:V-type ATP synthase subunit C n=1 Tax=Oceanithermus profundus TaxID=187137 RepID=A0A7C4VCL7_9DEIN|nr:V-type ATP synthase subunit C [Oceanithermus profundus]
MTDDFGYLNARVRVRRSSLLPEGFFQEALNLSFPDLLGALSETPYGEHLSGEDLGALDRAVAAHWRASVGSLPSLVGGEAREAVVMLLSRADLANIKAILRAKETGLSADEIKAHLTGGTLPEAVLQAMIEAPDAAGVAQALILPGHPLSGALRAAVAAGGTLTELEVALDRAYFEGLRTLAKKIDDAFLQDYLAYEIDGVNLSTAFKLAQQGGAADASAYFVKGGRHVSEALFTRIAGGETAAVDELAGTPLEPLAGTRDLGAFEHALRCLLLERAARGGVDSDGAGLVTAFIRAKEWEAARLRLVARRAYYGLPAEAVEREVFCS